MGVSFGGLGGGGGGVISLVVRILTACLPRDSRIIPPRTRHNHVHAVGPDRQISLEQLPKTYSLNKGFMTSFVYLKASLSLFLSVCMDVCFYSILP